MASKRALPPVQDSRNDQSSAVEDCLFYIPVLANPRSIPELDSEMRYIHKMLRTSCLEQNLAHRLTGKTWHGSSHLMIIQS